MRHALTHTVGVPGIPADTTPEDLCDWDKMCAVIADAEPWWEPGARTAYHAYPFGYIIGEIIRRATGNPISQVLREDVAGPLGVADELFFGVPESELGRLARLEDEEGSAEFLAAMPDDSPFFKWGPRATFPTADFGNRPDVLMADIPAGGKMSARAVARMYAALMDEVDGVRLLLPARLREVSAVAFSGVDEIMGNPVSWALGLAVLASVAASRIESLGGAGSEPVAALNGGYHAAFLLSAIFVALAAVLAAALLRLDREGKEVGEKTPTPSSEASASGARPTPDISADAPANDRKTPEKRG